VRRILAPVAADERSLDWRLSARENLRFYGTLHGFRGATLRERMEEVLAAVELQDVGGKQVGMYSSGMRQRLLIARALLPQPRVLLLDEPTRSLDPLAARSFRAFLRSDIAGKQGCTILLATHDPDEALELSDRVAVLHRGRLLATGSPAELARSFATERYRLWTRTPDHHAIHRALVRCAVPPVRERDESEGMAVVEFDLPEGVRDPGDLLAGLVAAGAHVARFEKVQLKLPDLMERVMRHAATENDA
jgi:ABC-type multidrug transport system ATPase subunit